MIKTGKKVIGTTGVAQHAPGTSTAQFRKNYRQYYAYITTLDNGMTQLVLQPKIYIGHADYADEKVWVLKGPAGEIKLWENLFANIEELL